MAGHMNLLSPFVFNQFGPYNAYAQTQQQAALMQAAAQGTYMNPMAALATQIPHTLGGELTIPMRSFHSCWRLVLPRPTGGCGAAAAWWLARNRFPMIEST